LKIRNRVRSVRSHGGDVRDVCLRVQVLHRAEAIFAGLPEEVTVLRTSCELALSKRDVGAALKRLRAVPPASPLYRAARTAFAEITLRYRKDERQFIAAHLDIVTTFKDYDAHVAAGDAFLSIQARPVLMSVCSVSRQLQCVLGQLHSNASDVWQWSRQPGAP